MGEHTVGYIILILIGLVLFGLLPLLLWRQWQRKKPRPTRWYKGVGIIYMDGAENPWMGLEEAIDILLDGLAQKWPNEPKLLKNIYVEVHPYEAVLLSEPGMTGFVDPESGLTVPAPTNEREAKAVMKIGGTRRKVRPCWPADWRHIAMVLQKRRDGAPWTHRLAQGSGPLRSAGLSTLFHEFVSHIVPDRLGEGLNRYHKREDLTAYENELHRRYKEEHGDE